ncbi:putative ABC transport system permease protein [Eubacterium ruminantium]|nr:putative ABC transport system permease protein [Eubacterium ruminantium]
MKVFLKYIRKNMFEKKSRLFLLIFSIAMSTALLVASAGIVEIIFNSFTKPYEQAQESDIGIVSSAEDPFIDPSLFEGEKLTDLICEIQTKGVVNENDKIRYVSIHGREAFDGKMKEGTADFISGEYTEGDFSCIISERIAKECKLSVGDSIKLYLSGEEINMVIKAISVNDGLFYADEINNYSMVVPYEMLNLKMHADGKFNYIGANLESGKVDSYLKQFNQDHPELSAYSLKSKLETDGSINAVLYLMLTIVVVVSSIIIHGVFKLIMTERLTVIGTFMSQGATKKKIERIVLLEGLMYALMGGVVGCALGEVLLFVINRLVSPLAKYGIYAPYNVNALHIVIGMVFAVLLSVISAYTPVRSIRKYEVKDVILGRAEAKQKNRKIKVFIGAALLIFSIVIGIINGKVQNVTSMIAMATAFAGIIMVTPTLVKYLAGFLAKLFRGKPTAYLTMNNIRTSKLLRNNIVLIVVSLSAVLLISSFGESMTKLVKGAYEDLDYDYSISSIMNTGSEESTTNVIFDKLNSIDGIDKESIATATYEMCEVDGHSAFIEPVDIIPYGHYLDRYTPLISQKGNDYQEFAASTDNAVYLTTKVADAIDKKKGDTVVIEVNSRKAEFRVAGLYDGKVYNNGEGILISRECGEKVFNITEASDIFFMLDGTRAASEVEADFKGFLTTLGATYQTKAEDCKANDESNAMVVNVMAVFAYLALIIASIGVFNNITISFHQRKREFAVMSSVGMDKKRRKNMILTESMFSVVMSILITVPFMILLTDLFTGSTYFVGIPMVTKLSWITVPKFSIVLAVIIFIASLSTMKKSKKLSIVQELKYE